MDEKIMFQLMTDLGNKLDNIGHRVSRMEGQDIIVRLDSINKKLDSIEQQQIEIEKKIAVIYAISGIIGAVGGGVVLFFKSIVNYFGGPVS